MVHRRATETKFQKLLPSFTWIPALCHIYKPYPHTGPEYKPCEIENGPGRLGPLMRYTCALMRVWRSMNTCDRQIFMINLLGRTLIDSIRFSKRQMITTILTIIDTERLIGSLAQFFSSSLLQLLGAKCILKQGIMSTYPVNSLQEYPFLFNSLFLSHVHARSHTHTHHSEEIIQIRS